MSIKNLTYKTISLIGLILMMSLLAVAQQDSTAKPNPDKKTTTRRISKKRPASTEKAVTLPSLEDRLIEQRVAVRRGEEREPTSPYLIEEILVNGIYKSVEGYGAFLKAINGRTFFAYAGMKFYDGEVLQIDSDQVVFQQNLPGGKKKQIVKAYDPSALRNNAIEQQQEREKKDKDQKKKKSKKDDEDDSESGDSSKDE